MKDYLLHMQFDDGTHIPAEIAVPFKAMCEADAHFFGERVATPLSPIIYWVEEVL